MQSLRNAGRVVFLGGRMVDSAPWTERFTGGQFEIERVHSEGEK